MADITHWPSPPPAASSSASTSFIRDVYSHNLNAEVSLLRTLAQSFRCVSMDTEFPGVVARPIGKFSSAAEYHYQTLRANVDLLKIIQLGLTLTDENGQGPAEEDWTKVGVSGMAGKSAVWQFHFTFSLSEDMYAPDSIALLKKSGIDFAKSEKYGIDPQDFAELMITSGLVAQPDSDGKWISFHSGYDFGYLLRLLSGAPLPTSETEFFALLKLWFPAIYDIKYLMKSVKTLKGGLQDVADDMGVARVGPQHQAGSDSLLTANAFFKMRELFFENEVDDSKYLNYLFGLGLASNSMGMNGSVIGGLPIGSGNLQNSSPYPLPATPQYMNFAPQPGYVLNRNGWER